MKATTHTEVYRPFEGELRPHPLRFLTIAWSGIRVGFKRKLPALLLYIPVAIACIIACFKVHFMFMLSEGPLDGGGGIQEQVGRGVVQDLLGDVVDNIFLYIQNTSFFGLITVAWYGAGLIAEDRRSGANLLYFSRPITRLDYMLGKFLSAAFFGALALTVPCLLVCLIASFSSPEWSFLLEEWDKIIKVLLFSMLWVTTVTIVVLAVSSLVNRKTLALVGVVGLVIFSNGLSEGVAELTRDDRFSLLSLFQNFERIGNWLFDRTNETDITAESSMWALVAVWVTCLAVLSSRVKKMEVVA